MKKNSQRVGREAQAASGSSRCSGRSLPQPGAPSGRCPAARRRAVMLPCPSSERGLTYGREGRRAVSGGQAPPRGVAASERAAPKAKCAGAAGLLPALPSPPQPRPPRAARRPPARPPEPRRSPAGADPGPRPARRRHRVSLFPFSASSRALCAVVPFSPGRRGADPSAQELPPEPRHSRDGAPAPPSLTRQGQRHGEPDRSR